MTREIVRSLLIVLIPTLALASVTCTSRDAPAPVSISPSTPPATAPASSAHTVVPAATPPGLRLPASQIPSGPVSSSGVVVSPDGALVAAVNPDSDSITIVDALGLGVVREITVGDDPRTLAFTPDSRLVLVANRGSANLSVVAVEDFSRVANIPVGPMPYGVVTDGRRAFVTEFALGNIGIIDLARQTLVERVKVAPFPAGLAFETESQDGGSQEGLLLVTHFFSGQVSAIDLSSLTVTAVASPGEGTNLSQFIVVAPDGMKAYLPQTRSIADNTRMTPDTTVLPVVNVLDLAEYTLLPGQRITIDAVDQPVNIPFAAVVSPDGSRLYIVHAGSDNLSVIDLAANQGLAHIRVGANPRGIAITPDGSTLFVNNTLDGTMSVIDAGNFTYIQTIALTTIPLAGDVLLGKKIFNSAASPVLTNNRWLSCASCHFDEGMDSQTWQGSPDGPRNTPALFGVGQTLPIHWSGDLDELQDVELTIRTIQFGAGLIPGDAHDSLGTSHTGLSSDLDALAAYLASIEVPTSPFGRDRQEIDTGKEKFTALGCQACHAPPLFSDLQLHDVGTGDPAKEKNSHGRGTNFDTPSLRGVWLTAPYFHDGSAATLREVFTTGTTHNIAANISEQELQALIAYLRALPINQ